LPSLTAFAAGAGIILIGMNIVEADMADGSFSPEESWTAGVGLRIRQIHAGSAE
jgi:hypothetical protein